jgi:hypothetical protein
MRNLFNWFSNLFGNYVEDEYQIIEDIGVIQHLNEIAPKSTSHNNNDDIIGI